MPLRIEVAWRDILPFAAGVNAHMPGRGKTVLGKVGDTLRQNWLREPCGENQMLLGLWAMRRWKARIGMFIVSSEPVPEAEWWAMMPRAFRFTRPA